ncbi:hypothetical protein GF367_04910 [Candidatus Woesearchaeota archaeon]|nr:hypothetical protein [Candidatus Woesearchaeota archaeon]
MSGQASPHDEVSPIGKIKETLEQLSKEDDRGIFHEGVKKLFEQEMSAGGDIMALKHASAEVGKRIEEAWKVVGLGYGTKDAKADVKRAQDNLRTAIHHLEHMKHAIKRLMHEKIRIDGARDEDRLALSEHQKN